ncbi:MAG: peptide chain release factor 3 [Spirochaetes bacterium]|nr:peptide chain release factor 3 [Spirochaetota bacterium]
MSNETTPSTHSESLSREISRRRTFAIISHPDAGKTTLTEKLLLFGGAIHTAGAVKANKTKRYATSDFMEIERQRGISVATSVMGFDYREIGIRLLDTPGHHDFSEDTYRTLTAVDSAVMVIDSVNGVESQTEKLLEVCRMRETPILTFINKMDREGQDPFALLDEIEKKLSIKVVPLSWPIGGGRIFKGVYNLHTESLVLFRPHGKREDEKDVVVIRDLADPQLEAHVGDQALKLREDLDYVRGVYPPFSREAYLAGKITPVFFGSAINNFGVKELLDCFVDVAPPPKPRPTDVRPVEPDEKAFTGFIFKIHANMDPKHRDRIAFLRVCSGRFERNQFYLHVKSGKQVRFANPTAFMAQNKEIIDDAWPGDIVGLHDTGNLRIGDTLSEGEKLIFQGIPRFAPELFRLVINTDPMKSKQLSKGLEHLMDEGVAQLFTSAMDNRRIVGVVGALQFEVIQHRLLHEYGASCRFEAMNIWKAFWLDCDEPGVLDDFMRPRPSSMVRDKYDHPVWLAESRWFAAQMEGDFPKIRFRKTAEI